MRLGWLSKNDKDGDKKHTDEQIRYDSVSNEIKTRKEYEYSLQLFRLWFSFVKNCTVRLKSEANMNTTDKMIIALYSLAIFNSYKTCLYPSDAIIETALDILRCYHWKQSIDPNKSSDINEDLTLSLVAEVSRCFLELSDYIEELQIRDLSEEDVFRKKFFFVVKQFGEINANASIIIAIEETSFIDKYSDFMNSLPNQWKENHQENDNKHEQNKTDMEMLSKSIVKRKEYIKCEEVYGDISDALLEFDWDIETAFGDAEDNAAEAVNRLQPDKALAAFLWFYLCVAHFNTQEMKTILDIIKLRLWKEDSDINRLNKRFNAICGEIDVLNTLNKKEDEAVYASVYKTSFLLSFHLFKEDSLPVTLIDKGYSRSIELALTKLLNNSIIEYCLRYESGHPLIRDREMKAIEKTLINKHGITDQRTLELLREKAARLLDKKYIEVIARSNND